jgi:phosphate-selective porin OprO/OprP
MIVAACALALALAAPASTDAAQDDPPGPAAEARPARRDKAAKDDGAPKPGRWKLPDDVTFELGLRIQPRLDVGDVFGLGPGTAPTSYGTGRDLYLRRVRLSVEGRLFRRLGYDITLEADPSGKAAPPHDPTDPPSGRVALYSATVGYKFADPLELSFGKQKLPFSRISLTTSAAQLLPERPFSTEAGKDLFGEYRPVSLRAEGRFLEGSLAWFAAVSDGLEAGGERPVQPLRVIRSDPLLVARVEVSPPGWAERRRRDAHLGEGRHFTLGVSVAAQGAIDYESQPEVAPGGEDRRLLGIDLSGHAGPFTAQAEGIAWEIDPYGGAGETVRPRGAYVQAGVLLGAVEPAIRLEAFDADADGDDDRLRALTVGLNWYLRGHDLKLQAAWVHVRRDRLGPERLAGDPRQNVVQLQGQLDL